MEVKGQHAQRTDAVGFRVFPRGCGGIERIGSLDPRIGLSLIEAAAGKLFWHKHIAFQRADQDHVAVQQLDQLHLAVIERVFETAKDEHHQHRKRDASQSS